MAAQVLTLPVTYTNFFLQPEAVIPAVSSTLTRIVRCRLRVYPSACSYMFLDGNQLELIDCTGFELLSASMNPITKVIGSNSVFALNLAYTRIVRFACSEFPALRSLSVKGCIYLREFDWAGGPLEFLDVRETRFNYQLRTEYGDRLLLTGCDAAEITSCSALYNRIGEYYRVQFENAQYALSLELLDACAARQLCCVKNDIADLRLIARLNAYNAYISEAETEAIRYLEDNAKELAYKRWEMLTEWRDLVQQLRTRYEIKSLPISAFFAAGNIIIQYNDYLSYKLDNSVLRSIAIQLVFENVEVNGKTVLYDPLECREYLKRHVSRRFMCIKNNAAVRFVCEGFVSDAEQTAICGNELIETCYYNTIQCEVYYSESLGLYVYVPVEILLSTEMFDIYDLLEQHSQLHNKYSALFNCDQYCPQTVYYASSFEEAIAQRIALFDTQKLDLHGCNLADSGAVQYLLQGLPNVYYIDISFNSLESFALKSDQVKVLNLYANQLTTIYLDCPTLRELDLQCNRLDFMSFFTGLSHRTKLYIEQLFLQCNMFDADQFRLIPAISRYFKNLKIANGIAVQGINTRNFTGIANYEKIEFAANTAELNAIQIYDSKELQNIADKFFLAPSAAMLNLGALDTLNCAYCSYFYVQMLQKQTSSLKAVNLSFTRLTQQMLDSMNLPYCQCLIVIGNDVRVPRKLAEQLYHLGADYIDDLLSPCCISQLRVLEIPNAAVTAYQLLALQYLRVLVAGIREMPEILYLLPYLEYFNDIVIQKQNRKQGFAQLTQCINAALLEACPIVDGVLDLSNLSVTSLRADEDVLGRLASVRKLVFDGNSLTSLEFLDSSFPAVYVASFQHNCLESPFMCKIACCKLTALDLSNNPIKSLKSAEFSAPALSSLRMQNTMVKSLNPASFAFLPTLEALDLSNNGFLTVSKETLQNLPNLRSLDVSSSCRNSLEIALRVRGHIMSFNCEFCKITALQTITWFCEKALNLKAIRCANNPFCMSFIKQNKSYIFDVLAANLGLQRIDGYTVTKTDVERILQERAENEAAKDEEIQQLMLGAQASMRPNKSSSNQRRGQSEKTEKLRPLEPTAMRVCGVLPPVARQ